MNRRLKQISAFLMVLVILFVSTGWNVKFHYCTVNHELTTSLNASSTCGHCAELHHDQHTTVPSAPEAVQLNAKSCCDDFDELIHFSSDYTFSTEKPLLVSLPFIVISDIILTKENAVGMILRCFTRKKIPYLITGRLKSIFFSNLKLATAHPYGMPR